MIVEKLLIVTAQKTADLVTFTKDVLDGKLHFLCSEYLA